ncbi:MAG: hypothetical protein KY463_05010 [Actinobacteria bacterium]|nr:hypothetical protein [Actinomycetota bacterium]
MTARLLTDHTPAGATAGVIFIQSASDVAHDIATLAMRSEGRSQALALRALRRASRLQEDVALEISSARSTGSLEDLIDALSAALRGQGALLDALDGVVSHGRISPRRRHALEVRRARANAARNALGTALTGAQRALQHPLSEVQAADAPAGDECARSQAHDR